MLRNYLKIAFRNIVKNKVYSFINIGGLAVGMAVAILIGLWVYNQYSYDRFLSDYQRLYRVQRNFDSNGDTLTFRSTSLKLAATLRNQIPEIEYVAESDWMGSHGLRVGDKKLYLNGGQVGTDFLKMFQYPFLQGNATTVFKDAYSIVLTESTAKALFGEDDPMDKMVNFDNQNSLKVTGIVKDLPANSSFDFHFLVPFTYLEQTNPNVKINRTGSYGANAYQIFVKLRPEAEYSKVYPKIRTIEHSETDNTNAMSSYVTLQPLERWHLYSKYVNGQDTEGFLEYVRMFTIIGLLVLLIACINFINLTTARSEKRAKEVGIRKAIGSMRTELILQFLTESLLLTVIAFVFALGMVQIVLGPFNSLTTNRISIPFLNIYFWLAMFVCIVFTALLAGSRPAFYLSSFQPIKVLKGIVNIDKSGLLSRKVLVILQFSCSIALIISTCIIYQQIQYAKDRPNGYDLNRLMATTMNNDLEKNFSALKNELIQKGIAESVTTASSPATDIYWHSDIDQWPGKNAGETVEMGMIGVTEDYFKTLGMTFKEGRDFTSRNDTTSVIFNEAAIKQLRIKNPINQIIIQDNRNYQIVGVVKDALMLSPFAPADPTLFFCNSEPRGTLMYRLSGRIKTQEAISQLTSVFTKYNPSFPFIYEFEDQNYTSKFNLEVLVGKLAGVFATLAIFISCLGLFGMVAYIAEQRTKEIGIRKVLGASVVNLWILLSKDFVILVIVSCLIASPLAYYFMDQWLQKYSYRTEISWWIFAIAAIGALIITLLTVSFQAIKAAVANPVRSLRSE